EEKEEKEEAAPEEEPGTKAQETEGTTETVQETAAAVYHSPVEIHFSENTAMVWPVSGSLVLDYSMQQTTYFPTLDQYKYNPSISVQAEVGDPVRAAASGKVLSIVDDARTGTTVTMELGDSYQAIYGQLTDLNISEGEMVEEGMVIGYVAEPTKYYTKEGTNLYFAMKRNGEPIDPILYLP
ncbi:MAG: M23 family metallopeptidase, partial [Blautia sp.]|nr:M23 family metallopeptidase [Blautia sp.]